MPNLDRLRDGHDHDDGSQPPRGLGQRQPPPPTADAVDGCSHRSPRRRKAADEQVRLNRENVAKSYAAMAKSGVQVIEATPQLVSDLKAASVKIWNDPKWEKAYTKEVMDRIKKEAAGK